MLIVDPNETTRFVLCELLRRSGVTPVAAGARLASRRAVELSASVIYIDADAVSDAVLQELVGVAAGVTSPIVVAGTNRPIEPSSRGVTFVRKPYHFRDLVHKILASLGGGAAPEQAAA
ncbi:hypothetical protein [Botrimarina sp.]|uniref:hypothetical protein n=1 Tax=Botrimarina sp. TaxID=2795802 RepID=UPI0032ED1CCA